MARSAVASARLRARPPGSDAGLTLVELMAAIVVFSLAASGIAAGFIAAVKASGTDRDRVAAANLAQRELEIVRNAFNGNPDGPAELMGATYAVNPNPLPGGTIGQPLVVDGRAYDVTRTIQLLPTGVGQSPCDGGAAVTYPSFAVQVQVTWPNMPKNVEPVESNTVLTPRKGFLDSEMSFVAVKVIDADGGPNQGRLVRLARNAGGAATSAVTAADGCAVLATTQTGAHTVTLDEDGHVDNHGSQSASRAVHIATKGSFQLLSFSYDAEAKIPVRLTTDPNHSVPGAMHVSLGHTGFTLGSRAYPVAPSGTTTLVDLWPAQDGYTVWAGSCGQSDPAAAGGVRGESIVVPPGGTAAEVEVRLAPVTVNVRRPNGTARGSTHMYAWPATEPRRAESRCEPGEFPIALGRTSSNGEIRTALPAGEWILTDVATVDASRPPASSLTSWPRTGTLLPDSEHSTIDVVVP